MAFDLECEVVDPLSPGAPPAGGSGGDNDALEALVATTNEVLTAINGNVNGLETSVDGLEALVGTTNTTLTAIDGHVDGLEASSTTLAGAVKNEDAVAASGDPGIMALGVQNRTLAATAADGDYAAIALGQGGEQYVTPSASAALVGSAPSNATTTAYAASLVIKGSAGALFGITGYNSLASAQFIQLHNASSLPADTAVPVVVITVPASSNFSIDFGVYGRWFTTGIVVSNSTTGPTKTIGAANCWFDAQFK